MSSTKAKLLDSVQKNLQKGQYGKAVADYRQIIQLEPSDIRHRQKLAELLTKANLKDDAISEYTSLAKHYIDSIHYLKAIAVYKQIQKLDPTNPEISLTLASLNEKQGLIGNATSEYASALQIFEKNGENLKALKVLESMLALDPGNSAVRLRIAEKYFVVGKESNSFDQFLALATDLKNRDDESGYQHVSDKIRHLFKERADDLFRKIEGGEEEEVSAPAAPTPDVPVSEPVRAAAATPKTIPSEKKKQAEAVAVMQPEPEPEPEVHDFSMDEEEPVDDIPLIDELEEIEELEEFSAAADEPEWEEDIELDLDVAHEEQSPESDSVQDFSAYAEPVSAELELEEPELAELELEEPELEDLELAELELDELELEEPEVADLEEPEVAELELDEIELELELDEEETADEALLSEPVETPPEESGTVEPVEPSFDLAGELSTFADEIDFDLIRTNASDSQFDLDAAAGFKRNELANEDAESHYSLGLAYKEMGLFDEAISEFLVASKSDERKFDSLILTAVCFRELGQTEMAVEILSDTLKLPDINDDALLGVKYELAICREALGEILLARQLYTEIMTVRPDFSDTASRIDTLQHS